MRSDVRTPLLTRQFRLLLALCVTVAVIQPRAQQPAASATPAKESLIVEFLAVTSSGEPVLDLRAEEITVRVGGRPRRLIGVEWIRVAPPPLGPDSPPAASLPPPFGSNAPIDAGRTMVLVIDDDSILPGREQPLRDAVRQFLVALSRRDRVALVTLPYGGMKVDFTTDRGAVLQAVTRITGQLASGQTGSQLACRTRDTLTALTGLLRSLAGGAGPTAFLFVSSALAAPRRDSPMALAPGVCELTTDQFEQVGTATGAARAQFYVIQPEDVQVTATILRETIAGAGFSGSDSPLAGLEHLAGVTGGHRLPLFTAKENNLTRITRELAGYYRVSFMPEVSDRPGSTQDLEVRTTRDGIAIRSRPSLAIPRPAVRAAKTPTTRDMLRETQPFRDLPLRAIGYSSLSDEKGVKILAMVEPSEPSAKLISAGAGLIDRNGKLIVQSTANDEELAASPVMTALIAPPGRYRLRMAATDASGRAGTADYEIDADLTPVGPLKVSGLVLGVSRPTGFRPLFQFSSEPVAIGYLELYGQTTSGVAVAMELAMTEDGPPIVALPAAIAATKEKDRYTATAAIPVGALPVGDFVVRAIIAVQGSAPARVTRVLRKQPR